ncbi:MAG TPA: septal ring lytic transglycosylase RlpA family protein [Xanthomonadaceae bacterium]|nr:septal ring lytic transglycosylase RlpA family protein [Xanthomonadaceae bacterium]
MTARHAHASMLRVACASLVALLLAACAGHPQKPAGTTAAQSASATRARPARKPWKPLGPYTRGGLYAPGVADGAPDIPADVANLPEPVPHAEPLSHYGNRSKYVVLGKTYTVLPSAAGYVERGVASWYGTKFDGRATSNFEPYDLYQFTAAHRTLPLPSYARVTNLDNGRSVIVRVNDRGPFHDGRLIDLSYAAAVKLGVNAHGTANVEVRGIDPGQPLPPVANATPNPTVSVPKPVVAAPKPEAAAQSPAIIAVMAATAGGLPSVATTPLKDAAPQPAATVALQPQATVVPAVSTTPTTPAPDTGTIPARPLADHPRIEPSTRGFLQVASYGDRANAEHMLQRLLQAGVEHAELLSVEVNGQTLWRVHIGPFSADEAAHVAEHLDALGFGNPPFFKD